MKYLKRIDELFDDEKIRSKFSYDYLSGDLSPEDTLEWDEYSFDSILNNLLEKVPYLNSFRSNRIGNILEFIFEEKRDGLHLLFLIEITGFESGSFTLNVLSSSFVNDKEDWFKSDIKRFKDIQPLLEYLKNDVFKMVNEFSDYISQYDIKIINSKKIKYDMN
jgi:hypothetical protein